nr:protein phosphatase 2C domain-containing protein [uncultured Marinifilum sp.]
MKILNQITSKGNLFNEDKIYAGNGIIVLLDGSTGLEKKLIPKATSDAVWFVNEVVDFIHNRFDIKVNYQDFINDMLSEIREKHYKLLGYKAQKLNEPSASMVFIIEKAEEIILINIGDCTNVIEFINKKICCIYDSRVSKLDNKVILKLNSLQQQNIAESEESKLLIQQLLMENRKLKNTANGYDILGFDKLILNNTQILSFPKNQIRNICSFTDGFAEHYEHFNLSSDAIDFYQQLKNSSADKILADIRNLQKKDSLCKIYPRLKKMDDASLVMIQIND